MEGKRILNSGLNSSTPRPDVEPFSTYKEEMNKEAKENVKLKLRIAELENQIKVAEKCMSVMFEAMNDCQNIESSMDYYLDNYSKVYKTI
jgi:hypothetical protein